MNAVRTNVAFRTTVTIVVLAAWVVLSNHCALAAVFAVKSPTTAVAESGCCKNQPKPADGDGPCPQLPQGCCKTLKVAMPGAAKVPHAVVALILQIVAEWVAMLTTPPPEKCCAAPGTAPPPDVPTFAGLVLNQSLLSHAPPSLK